MPSVSEERAPIRGIELAMAALVADGNCPLRSMPSRFRSTELSLEALGPFAIVYHDKQPSFVLLPLLIGLLLLVKHFLPAVGAQRPSSSSALPRRTSRVRRSGRRVSRTTSWCGSST